MHHAGPVLVSHVRLENTALVRDNFLYWGTVLRQRVALVMLPS
jgi:hypothetical protein